MRAQENENVCSCPRPASGRRTDASVLPAERFLGAVFRSGRSPFDVVCDFRSRNFPARSSATVRDTFRDKRRSRTETHPAILAEQITRDLSRLVDFRQRETRQWQSGRGREIGISDLILFQRSVTWRANVSSLRARFTCSSTNFRASLPLRQLLRVCSSTSSL